MRVPVLTLCLTCFPSGCTGITLSRFHSSSQFPDSTTSLSQVTLVCQFSVVWTLSHSRHLRTFQKAPSYTWLQLHTEGAPLPKAGERTGSQQGRVAGYEGLSQSVGGLGDEGPFLPGLKDGKSDPGPAEPAVVRRGHKLTVLCDAGGGFQAC